MSCCEVSAIPVDIIPMWEDKPYTGDGEILFDRNIVVSERAGLTD